MLGAAAAAGGGVLNGWSILRGLLTGADIDEARKNYRNDDDVAAACRRWQWCREEGVDPLHLALQFCLREERIHGNPIGNLNAAQLEANIRAASTPLEEAVWERYLAAIPTA